MDSESPPLNILLVEDDAKVRQRLAEILTQANYRVTPCSNGSQAIDLLRTQEETSTHHSIVISDIRLGDIDGLQVLTYARGIPQPPTVILMTGYGTLDTAIAAIREGAFDYLVKPFNSAELLACVHRAGRDIANEQQRSQAIRNITMVSEQLRSIMHPAQTPETAPDTAAQSNDRFVRVGDLVIDRYRHGATFMDEPLRLTPIEYALLLCLGEMQGRVIPYSEIVRRTHNYFVDDSEAQSMLKVHIHNLRQKIDPTYLVNIRGTGYMLAVP